ncbi:MAG: peptidylprolyl isomerase [Bacteroidales bacterium]
MNTRKLMLSLVATALFTGMYGADAVDPDIITINGKGIKKSEFEYIYNKNTQQQIEQKSLNDYLKMFCNYKLKVMEAEAAGIDTTAAFISELAGYRNQLAQPYLVDNAVDENLAMEAYNRLKENVEVAHILLLVDNENPEKSKAKVYEKALNLAIRARKGESFEKLAAEYSEDPSAKKNSGNLGYIKGFMTVYPFECAAFNTKVGTISDPVLSRYGYHIVKVISRRADPGEVLTAHIMVMLPSDISNEAKKEKESKIREIYGKLQSGADFAEMVKEFSEDPGTRDTEGLLQWISTGRTVQEYENVAFALKNPGDISEPFITPYGWHIVKLVEKRGIKPFEEMRMEIMHRISRDERSAQGQKSLIAKLKTEYSYNLNSDKLAEIKKLAQSISLSDTSFVNAISGDKSVLFTIGAENYTVANFAKYLNENKNSTTKDNIEILNEKIDAFIDYSVISYEDARLNDKYSDFRNLMDEYHDGMLLFEISNREVWDKAAKDTKGLKSFFKKHKKNYAWKEPRFKGYAVQCTNDSVSKLVKRKIKKLASDSAVYKLNKEFNVDTLRHINVKRALFVLGENKVVDYYAFHIGKTPIDDKFPVSFVKGKILKKGPEDYTDIKGQITADYQNELEKSWVEELNEKYNIVIHKDVVATVKER